MLGGRASVRWCPPTSPTAFRRCWLLLGIFSLHDSRGKPSLSPQWPAGPRPLSGRCSRGVWGDIPLPLGDPWVKCPRGGWADDEPCKTTAPPPSQASGGEGRGAGAGTMGCGADSNNQFLVASSPHGLDLATGGKAEGAHFARPVFEARRERPALLLQPWPRRSGCWHPGTAQVRQQRGRGWQQRSGQPGRWGLRGEVPRWASCWVLALVSRGCSITAGSVLPSSVGLVPPSLAWPQPWGVPIPFKPLPPFSSTLVCPCCDKARGAQRRTRIVCVPPTAPQAGAERRCYGCCLALCCFTLPAALARWPWQEWGRWVSPRQSQPGPLLLPPSLLRWLISCLGPLCPRTWPCSPLRRLPRIVPAPQSVKPAGHRGNGAFLEHPYPARGCSRSSMGSLRTQDSTSPAPGAVHCQPVLARLGMFTGGRLAGSWPWPPVPGGALSCSVW